MEVVTFSFPLLSYSGAKLKLSGRCSFAMLRKGDVLFSTADAIALGGWAGARCLLYNQALKEIISRRVARRHVTQG